MLFYIAEDQARRGIASRSYSLFSLSLSFPQALSHTHTHAHTRTHTHTLPQLYTVLPCRPPHRPPPLPPPPPFVASAHTSLAPPAEGCVHRNISCDVCGASPLRGTRFKVQAARPRPPVQPRIVCLPHPCSLCRLWPSAPTASTTTCAKTASPATTTTRRTSLSKSSARCPPCSIPSGRCCSPSTQVRPLLRLQPLAPTPPAPVAQPKKFLHRNPPPPFLAQPATCACRPWAGRASSACSSRLIVRPSQGCVPDTRAPCAPHDADQSSNAPPFFS